MCPIVLYVVFKKYFCSNQVTKEHLLLQVRVF